MPVQNHAPPVVYRRTIFRSSPDEKFTEQESLLGQPRSALIARKQSLQLIAKHTRTTRLQNNEGHPGIDLRPHPVENILQILACLVKKTKIIKRAATADMLGRDLHAKSRCAQDLVGGGQHLGMKVI